MCCKEVALLEILKQALCPMDCLIFVAAAILFTQLDYAALTTVEIVYMATFGIWLLLLVARIVIICKKDSSK